MKNLFRICIMLILVGVAWLIEVIKEPRPVEPVEIPQVNPQIN